MMDPRVPSPSAPGQPPAPAAAWQPLVYHARQHRALRRWARATARLALVGSLLLPALRVPPAHAAPTFGAPQTNPFGLVAVGTFSAPTLGDLDGDGDLDALIGTTDGTLRYQANTGTALVPAFAVPQTNPFGLVDVGLTSTPTLGDLDADGDLDALIGAGDGTLRFQANTGTALVPAFAAPQTGPFGLVDVGFYSAPTLGDLDRDGDLDALIGEDYGTLRYQRNTGTATAPAFAAAQTNPFGLVGTGNDSTPVLADLDADGDLDALIGDYDGTLRYQQNGDGPLVPAFAASQVNPFNLQDLGSTSTPTLGDLDGDGDLDAVIGDYDGTLRYQPNTGTMLVPAFGPPQTVLFGLQDVGRYSAPELADLDADGDLDFLTGAGDGNLHYRQNTGSATMPAFAAPQFNPFSLADVGYNSVPILEDLDGDGDLDALMGSGGPVRYQPNTGTVLAPAFGPAQLNPFGLQGVSRSATTLGDLDSDGDLDAIIGSNDGLLRYQPNTGTALAPAFAAPQTNPFGLQDVGNLSTPTLADLDGDSDLDALIGNEAGELRFQRNQATPLAVTLADFAAQAQGDAIRVTWTTTLETEHLGFNVWRGTAPDAPTEQLNATLLPAQGAGVPYAWVDASAEPGVTYFYWLDAVGTDGGTTRHGPISATLETSSAVTLTAIAATPAQPPAGLRAGLAVLGATLLGTLGWHRWRRWPRDRRV